MRYDDDLTIRKKAVPAWLLSMAVHVLWLVFLAFVFVGAKESVPQDEQARPVGIVLSRKVSATQTEYFSELEETDSVTRENTESATNNSDSATSAAAESRDSLVISEFALPDAVSIPLPGVRSIDTPSLTVSGRRPKLPGIDDSSIIAEEQARFLAANARGPTTKLGLFGSKEALGNSFVFLIDRSKSMGGNGLGVLQDAEKELVRVLKPLEPEHRFQVIVYHDRCIYLNERELLAATDENKAAVPEFLSGKAAFGATEHGRALMSALRLEPDVIFLLTDGGDPRLKDHEVRGIAKLAGSRTAIHCLHFGSGPLTEASNFLMHLAALTGGEYGYIDVRRRRP